MTQPHMFLFVLLCKHKRFIVLFQDLWPSSLWVANDSHFSRIAGRWSSKLQHRRLGFAGKSIGLRIFWKHWPPTLVKALAIHIF